MAYKCSFLDNEVYGATDVNNVFACLTSGGVVYSDTGNIMSDLNEAIASTVGSGVTYDVSSCKVVKDGLDYKILPGACFMDDGSMIIFYDAETIEVPHGVKRYVYLERNPAANSIDVAVSMFEGGEKSIPLAEIAEDGTIADTRKFAVSKVKIGVGNTLRNGHAEFYECINRKSETVCIDIGSGNFSYIVLWGGSRTTASGDTDTRVAAGANLEEIAEGEETYLYMGKYTNIPIEIVYFKKVGSNLEIRLCDVAGGSEYSVDFAVI